MTIKSEKAEKLHLIIKTLVHIEVDEIIWLSPQMKVLNFL